MVGGVGTGGRRCSGDDRRGGARRQGRLGLERVRSGWPSPTTLRRWRRRRRRNYCTTRSKIFPSGTTCSSSVPGWAPTDRFRAKLIENWEGPMVVDADALSLASVVLIRAQVV